MKKMFSSLIHSYNIFYNFSFTRMYFIFYPWPENSVELLKSSKEWLDNRPKADLSKLPIHLKSNELDMSGTFKKLDID